MTHTIHEHNRHYGWDNRLTPVVRIEPGAEIEFKCEDSSGGQLHPGSTPIALTQLDFGKLNPTVGPVYVEGAKPGDALAVRILNFGPIASGWTAIIPGFGLLAEQFTKPHLHWWGFGQRGSASAAFGSMARVPIRPFPGTIGLAPAEPGVHSVVPPRRVGGNLDIRDLVAGSVLYLPVEVEGALLSVGDLHAAQGDGEVCGTAIECSMDVAVSLTLVKNANLPAPRFQCQRSISPELDSKGYEVTTGVGSDLMRGAKDAVSYMIDLLCSQHGLSPEEAYMLCSVCGNLRISEIVDVPNWVVSFYFPRAVFD